MPVSRPRPLRGAFPPVRSAMVSHILARRCFWFPAPLADSRSGLILAGYPRR